MIFPENISYQGQGLNAGLKPQYNSLSELLERTKAYDQRAQNTLYPQQQQQPVQQQHTPEDYVGMLPPYYAEELKKIKETPYSKEQKMALAREVFNEIAKRAPDNLDVLRTTETAIRHYVDDPYDELGEKIAGSAQHSTLGMLARGALPEYQPSDNLGDQLLHSAVVGAAELPIYAGAGFAGSFTGPAAGAVTFGLPPALNSLVRSHYTPTEDDGNMLSEHTPEALFQAGKEGLLGAGMGVTAGLAGRAGRTMLPELAGKLGAPASMQRNVGKLAGVPSEFLGIAGYEQATHPLYFANTEQAPERSLGESFLHTAASAVVPMAGAKLGRFAGDVYRNTRRPKPEGVFQDPAMRTQNEAFFEAQQQMGEAAPRTARDLQYKAMTEYDVMSGRAKREGRTPAFDTEALYREGMTTKDDRTAFVGAMGNAKRIIGEQRYKEITEGRKSTEIPREERLEILNRTESAMSEAIWERQHPDLRKSFKKGTLDRQRDEVVSDIVFGVMKQEGMSRRILESDKGREYVRQIKNNEVPVPVFRGKKKNMLGYEVVTTDSLLGHPRPGGKYGRSKEPMTIEAYADELIPVHSLTGHTEFIYKPRRLKEVSAQADLATGNEIGKAKQRQAIRTIQSVVEDPVFSKHPIEPANRTSAQDIVKNMYPECDQYLSAEMTRRRTRNGRTVEEKYSMPVEKPVIDELSMLQNPYKAGPFSKAIASLLNVEANSVKMGLEQFQNWYRIIEMISGGRWTLTKEIFTEAPRAALDNLRREQTHARQVMKKYIEMAPHKDSADAITHNILIKSEDGVAALNRMGIRPESIRQLDGAETMIMESIQRQYANLFVRYNKARVHAGLEPIREKAEYVTFFKRLEGVAEEHALSPVQIKTEKEIRALTPKFELREGVGGPIETNIFRITDRYMSDVLRYIHVEPVVKRMSDILNIEGINGQKYSLRAQAPDAYKLLTDYVNWIASGRNFADTTQQAKTMNKVADTLSNNLTASMLMYSVPTVLNQLTALTNAIPHIGVRWLYTGMQKVATDVVPKMNTEANPAYKSRHLGSRKTFMDDANIASMVRRNLEKEARTIVGEKYKEFAKAGFWALQNLDYVVARVVWEGAYQKVLAKQKQAGRKANQEEAIRYAEDIVVRTQASAGKTDLSPIQMTSMGRALTLFQTFTMSHWNMLRELTGSSSSMNYTAGQKLLSGLTIAMIYSGWNTLYEDVLGIESPMPAPFHTYQRYREEGKDPELAALRAISEMGKVVPMLGGGIRFGSGFLGPAPSMLHMLSQGVSNPERFAEQGAWGALKLFSALPASQAKRVIDAIQDDLGLKEALVGQREFQQRTGQKPYRELPYTQFQPY